MTMTPETPPATTPAPPPPPAQQRHGFFPSSEASPGGPVSATVFGSPASNTNTHHSKPPLASTAAPASTDNAIIPRRTSAPHAHATPASAMPPRPTPSAVASTTHTSTAAAPRPRMRTALSTPCQADRYQAIRQHDAQILSALQPIRTSSTAHAAANATGRTTSSSSANPAQSAPQLSLRTPAAPRASHKQAAHGLPAPHDAAGSVLASLELLTFPSEEVPGSALVPLPGLPSRASVASAEGPSAAPLAQQLAQAEQLVLARRLSSLQAASQAVPEALRLAPPTPTPAVHSEAHVHHGSLAAAPPQPPAATSPPQDPSLSADQLLLSALLGQEEEEQQQQERRSFPLRHLGLSQSGHQGRLTRLIQAMSIKLLPLDPNDPHSTTAAAAPDLFGSHRQAGNAGGDLFSAALAHGGDRARPLESPRHPHRMGLSAALSAVTPTAATRPTTDSDTTTPRHPAAGVAAKRPLLLPADAVDEEEVARSDAAVAAAVTSLPDEACPRDTYGRRKRRSSSVAAAAYALLATTGAHGDGASPTRKAGPAPSGGGATAEDDDGHDHDQAPPPLHPSPFVQAQDGASPAGGYLRSGGVWGRLRAEELGGAPAFPSLLQLHARGGRGAGAGGGGPMEEEEGEVVEEPLTPTAATAAAAMAGAARLLDAYERHAAAAVESGMRT